MSTSTASGINGPPLTDAHDDEDRATFEAKTGVRLADLKGLRVLDAGCGGGRYARICGEAGAIVVGADHTRAVDKARQICSHLPNVQFVQADLKHLPLEAASFDFVFSIGVMHHDVETRRVFDAVARMVKPEVNIRSGCTVAINGGRN